MISLEDQARLASAQVDFQQRVMAASFQAAVTAFGKTPLTDQTKQDQRLGLVNQLLRDPSTYGKIFAWGCVSRPTLNAISDLTDDFLITTCDQIFDIVAQQVIRAV